MSANDKTDRVWEIIEHVGIAMLTTRFRGGLRARPVELRPDRASGLIWFLTDARSAKDDEIGASPAVGLAMTDADARAYLSITARAEVLLDAAKAKEIWKATDKMWWEGPTDPNLRAVRIEPEIAELWDGPASAAVATYEFVKSRLTGAEPNLGQNRKVSVDLALGDPEGPGIVAG